MEALNTTLGILTIVGQVFALKLFLVFLFRKKLTNNKHFDRIHRWSLPLAFLTTLLAIIGSLAYSNIVGFEPCNLCWWQRIFHYPLALLFLVAIIRKDWAVKFYALPLAVIGAAIALFHYFIQRFNVHSIACDVMGQSPSCAGFYVFEFGYITIPMMSLTVFAIIILLMFFVKKR
jgi:disulfide bond formation protein DsbB